MSKWTIAGLSAGAITLLTGSFFIGRYTGKRSVEKANDTFVVHEVNKAA